MKRYLYLAVLLFSLSALKSNAQCNGWLPLGTFDSIQVSFDSASYTAIAAPNNGPPIIVYSDAKVGGKISAVYPTLAGKWKNFGKEGFSTGPVQYTCIAYGKGNKPYVAYEDLANNRLTVKQAATANSWTAALGTNAASLTNARFISLAIDTSSGHDSVYVAYSDGTTANKLTVMKLKGPSWVPVGTKDFSAGAANYISLKINSSTPYVVYSDSANGWKCTIEDFTGGTWKLFDSLLSPGVLSTKGAAFNSLQFDNSNAPYVAFQDSNNGNKGTLVTLGLVALTFSAQTNACTFNSDIATDVSMCLDGNGNVDIVYNDVTKGFVNALQFTPDKLLGQGNYAVLGVANLSAGSGSFCGISSVKIGGNPTPFVVYKDTKAGGKATAMAYNIAGNNLWDYIFWPIGITNNPTANPPAYGYNTSLTISKGIPYVAYTDANGNTDNVSVMSYTGGNWAYAGSRGSVSTAAGLAPQISTDGAGNVYTAYIDGTNGFPYLKKLVGVTWQAVGGSGGQVINKVANYISLAFDGSNQPYIITDNNGGLAFAQYYNGASWGNAGSGGGFTTGNASYIASAFDKSSGKIYAVATDAGNANNATLYSYSGSSWANLGGVSTTGAIHNSIAVDNSGNVYIACQDPGTLRGEVWQYAGGTFYILGTGGFNNSFVTPGPAYDISIQVDSLGIPYISFNDGTNQNRLTVMKDSAIDTNWTVVGHAAISSGEIEGNTSLAMSGTTPYVAYQDRGVDVQKFNAPAPGQITVTPAEAVTCPGSSIKLTASGASNYTWYPGGLTGSTISVTNTGGNAVQFSATAILATGCPADTGKALVAISNGADNIYTIIGNGYGAGTGTFNTGDYTGDGSPAFVAGLNTVTGVAFNPAADTMYIADQQNSVVRQVVMKTGIITTIAGSYANGGGFSGDGGPATAAGLNWPSAVNYYKGNLYIADQSNSCIRKVNLKTGIITSVAGNGNTGAGYSGDGAAATAASLYNPTSITFDGAGNMYIADYENHVVRMVNTAGIISTFAGKNAFPGFITSGQAATASELYFPAGVAYDATGNNIYIADQGNDLICKVSLATGIMYAVSGDTASAIAGTPNGTFSGDNGPAKSAILNGPIGVTVDATDNIYIADERNERIREISSTGIINTIAGNGNLGYSGDNGPAPNATLGNPWAVALDPAGNIYIPDNYNNVVREIKVCAGVLSVVINTPAKPDTICPGGHDTLKAYASGGTPPYTYSWSTGGTSSSIVVSPTTPTTYSVSVKSASTGTVTATSTFTVVVLNTAITTTSTGGTALCSGTNDTIKATGGIATSYRWKPSSGLNTTTGSRVVFTAPAVGTATTVTLTVTDTTIYGCPDSAKIIIQVNPTPTITLKAAPATICAGSSTTLTGSGATYYAWSPASGLVNTISSGPITDTVKVTTTYTAVGTISVTGCSAKDSITVTVNPSPKVTLTTTLHSFCKGDSATLTAAGATSYTWSGSGLSSTTGTSVIAKPAPGTYTYVVTGTSAGCTDTAKVIITVNPTPTLTINTTATTLCQGGSTTLNAGGASVYSWNTGATTSSITVNPSISTTYTLTGNNGGCSVKDSIAITVTPGFTVSATASPTVICTGLSSTLTANSSGGGTYTWNNGSTGTSIIVSPTTSTTYTVTEVNGNCSATATTTVVVTPFAGSLTTSVTPATCNGSCNGTATLNPSGGNSPYTYTWSTGATTSSITSCSGSPTYTITDNSGCKAKGTVTITQPLPITGTITASSACSGGSTGTATISSVSGGTSPYTYSWSNSATTTSITGLSAGSYTVTVKDANNCTATFSVTVNQSSQIIDSIATTLTVNNKCYGAAKGSATVDVSGGTPAYTYTWSSGQSTSTITNLAAGTYTCNISDKNGCNANAVTVTITQPLTPFTVNTDDTTICGGAATLHALASGGTAPLTYTWAGLFVNGQTNVVLPTTTTTYTIIVSDKNGCTTSANDVVTVTNTMTQTVSASSTTVCAGRSVTLSDNVSGGITPYSYDWKQGSTSLGNNQSVTVTTFSTTTYTVTACCNCDGSSLQGTVTVNVISAPAISVCCDSSIQAGQAVQLIASGSTYSYFWTPSGGLSCTQCPTPVATPTINTTYYVTSTDTTDKCATMDSVTILVSSGTLVFYHGITPNGDGHNDVWVIDNIETYDNTSVAIFNRWGIEVWSAANYNNTTIAWNGNDKSGKPLPDATYFYVVKVNGTTYKGWVQLTR